MTAPIHIDPREIDEIRERVSIDSVVGRVVKLSKAGRGYKGLCPFHAENSPSFSVQPDKKFYHCFGCGAHGDIFRFVMVRQGLSFPEAVQQLAADGGVSLGPVIPAESTRRTRRQSDRPVVDSAVAGRWMWRAARPARGTIVASWLEARGLDIGAFGVGDGIDRLRFLPNAPAGAWRVDEDPARYWLRAPAMIAPVSDEDGHIRAVHVTYLAADGCAKAVFPPKSNGDERETRKIYGPFGRRAAWLSGTAQEGPGRPLFVGEGIETCWSYAQRWTADHGGRRPRVAAALSLSNLEGGTKKIDCRDGQAWRMWRHEADLARAPFLVRRAGEVHLLVDADMKPLRDQLMQRERHGRFGRGDISQAERADICAAVATQHWRAAGAGPVVAMRPPMGMDFNDLARERRLA